MYEHAQNGSVVERNVPALSTRQDGQMTYYAMYVHDTSIVVFVVQIYILPFYLFNVQL